MPSIIEQMMEPMQRYTSAWLNVWGALNKYQSDKEPIKFDPKYPVRYNTDYMPHYIYRLHKQWNVTSGGFTDKKDRVLTENK